MNYDALYILHFVDFVGLLKATGMPLQCSKNTIKGEEEPKYCILLRIKISFD